MDLFLSPQQRENHLLSICSAVGGIENRLVQDKFERVYVPGDEVLECLKDLKRVLREDDGTKDKFVLRKLGHWKVVQKDLIPLLQTKPSLKITSLVIELLVPLTWPVDFESKDVPAQLEYLKDYKETILLPGVISWILEFLLNLLSIDPRERNDRDTGKIRLVLLIFRNLLAIKDSASTIIATTEREWKSTLQEQFILRLEEQGIFPLFLSLAGSAMDREFKDWNLIILELFYYLYIDRDVDDVLNLKKNLLLLEAQTKPIKAFKRMTTRHPRFGGTISIQLSDGNKFNVHSPLTAITSLDDSFNRDKSVHRQGGVKTKKESKEFTKKKYIQDARVKEILARTMYLFLENGFNPLILSVKREFDIESNKVQEADYSRFLWLSKFCTEFFSKMSKPQDYTWLAGLLNVRGILFLYKRIHMNFEDKKYTELQIALGCLNQVLVVLFSMSTSNDENTRAVSEAIQTRLFYEGSNIELLASLCKDKKPHGLPYLKTLVQTVHHLLEILEIQVLKQETDRFHYIEQTFAFESVIQCYTQLLENYRELDSKSIWCIAVMFHRIFVKCKGEALFYKLSIFELFNRVLSEPKPFGGKTEWNELTRFIQHVLKKFFKCIDKQPMVLLDMLYAKTKSDCFRIQNGDVDMSISHAMESNNGEASLEQEPEEEEVPWADKVKSVVKLLRRNGQVNIIEWIIQVLQDASQKRTTDSTCTNYEIQGELEYQMECLEENELVAELFQLLSFKRTIEQIWEIPGSLTPQELDGYVTIIQDSLKRKTSKPRTGNSTSRRRRRGENGDKDVAAAPIYVSEQFIQDSDEDMNDEEFFQREAQLRQKWSAINSGVNDLSKNANVANTLVSSSVALPEVDRKGINNQEIQKEGDIQEPDKEVESDAQEPQETDQESESNFKVIKKRKTIIVEDEED